MSAALYMHSGGLNSKKRVGKQGFKSENSIVIDGKNHLHFALYKYYIL